MPEVAAPVVTAIAGNHRHRPVTDSGHDGNFRPTPGSMVGRPPHMSPWWQQNGASDAEAEDRPMPESLVDMGKDQIEETFDMLHVQTNVLQKKAHARWAKGKDNEVRLHKFGQMHLQKRVGAQDDPDYEGLPTHDIDFLARGFEGFDATGRKDDENLLRGVREKRGERPDRKYMWQHFGVQDGNPNACGFRSESAHSRPVPYKSDDRLVRPSADVQVVPQDWAQSRIQACKQRRDNLGERKIQRPVQGRYWQESGEAPVVWRESITRCLTVNVQRWQGHQATVPSPSDKVPADSREHGAFINTQSRESMMHNPPLVD